MQDWTDEQRAFRDSYAERFATWGAGHRQCDQAGEFPSEQWKLVRESGLLGLPFNVKWGGLGRDLLTTMYVLENLGYNCRDGGLNFSVATHIVSAGIPIQRFGSAVLKQRYLPDICNGSRIGAHAITEPDAGSDAVSMVTTATSRGTGFVLNGEKFLISNGPIGAIFVVYARTAPGDGPFGITAFVVDRDAPGLVIGPPMATMGLRSSPLGSLSFRDCVVPSSNVVGSVGHGLRILDHVLTWEILCSFAISTGAMQYRMERCIDFARSRTQFGSPIGSNQLISSKIVDMKIGLETARKWLYDTGERFLGGMDVTVDLAITKVLASEANLKSAADAVQIFGGRGYLVDYGLEKDLRDATGGTIYSGTSEVQRDKIARLLGVAERKGKAG